MDGKQKGFSLVELVVSMAILMVVGIAILGFFTYCVGQYNRSSDETVLQMETQTTQSKLQEILLKTEVGVAVEQNGSNTEVLSLFSREEDGTPVKLALRHENDTLVYEEYQLDNAWDDTGEESNAWKLIDKQLYASYVKNWEVQLYDQDGTEIEDTTKLDGPRVAKVEIILNMQANERTYNTFQTIALRNAVVASDKRSRYILAGKIRE